MKSIEEKKFYSSWNGLTQRCLNPNNPDYHRYSKRGVCDEWLIFSNFRKDMWKSFLKHIKEYGIKNTSLDRIDNDGSYCKKNCRWATYSQQVRHRDMRAVARLAGLVVKAKYGMKHFEMMRKKGNEALKRNCKARRAILVEKIRLVRNKYKLNTVGTAKIMGIDKSHISRIVKQYGL